MLAGCARQRPWFLVVGVVAHGRAPGATNRLPSLPRASPCLVAVSMPLTTTHGVKLCIRKCRCARYTRYTRNCTPVTAKEYSHGGRPGRGSACGARGRAKANKRSRGNRRGQQVPKSNWSMEEYGHVSLQYTWKCSQGPDIDLTALVPQLDTVASDLVAHQRDTLTQRKELAQKTKDFRKLDDESKLSDIKGLLKCTLPAAAAAQPKPR